jgi:Leucine-rich repeat (LRR) protein
MRYRSIVLLFTCLFLQLTVISQEKHELTPQQVEEYTEQSKQIIQFLEGTLNFLGDDTQLPSDKDVIINESYLKFFRDDEVQIEDDLDENREISLSKDVQAYLKDVDFFFNEVTFTFYIEKVEQLVNDQGDLYFKVTMNRHLEGITIANDTVDNNMIRYAEINLDPDQKDLKIVSLYTTKLNERQELRYWWEHMAVTWKNFFSESVLIYDTLPFHKIVSFDDSTIVVEKWVNTIMVDTFLVQQGDTINYGAVAERLATDQIYTVSDTISQIEPDTIAVDATPIYKQLMRFKKIKTVDVSNNMMIGNLDPVSELTDLTVIDFSNTLIDDISPLRNLNQLQKVDCSGTPVTDINPLRYANNLSELDCSFAGITDFSVLEHLKQLEKLDLSYTPILSVDILASLTKLKQLKISGTQLTDLSALDQLSELAYLNVSNSKMTTLNSINSLGGLKNLNIDSTAVTDLSPLSSLQKLSVLQANHTSVSDLSPLENLHELDIIYCDNSGINALKAQQFMEVNEGCLVIFNSEKLFEWWSTLSKDWKHIVSQNIPVSEPITKEELHQIINRTSLNIQVPVINSLEPVSMIYRLEKLDASSTQVSDVGPLSSLNHLRELNLNNTSVASLEPLTSLDNIRTIWIENTGVNDLMPLQNCTKLQIVYCDKSKVTTDNVLKYKNKLPDCLVVYQSDNMNMWWTSLDDEWKQLLKKEAGIDGDMTRENMQRVADLNQLTISDKLSIRNLESLTVFLQLTELIISNTAISDISPITSLPNLTRLDITSSPINSVERIRGLKQLTHLNIENTPVENIEPIFALDGLTSLNISGTQVKNLKGIEDLKKLEVLSINNTNIKNLKPVEQLYNLKEFRCFNTSVKYSKIEDFKAAHPGVEVVYY